ncbi:hypothetical protein GCM10008965_48120 [Methylorubrum aminovorans]
MVEPLMPKPAPCGRPPVWTMREILHAIFYVLRGGIAWRLIPKDLPPRSTDPPPLKWSALRYGF